MIHREAWPTIFWTCIFSVILLSLSYWLAPEIPILFYASIVVSAFLLIIVIQFFRNPKRNWNVNDAAIVSPADGKVVVIEEVEETEYFKDRRIQISVFMSPLNVHVNRNPVSGTVKLAKYHPGLYLVAWHPKSSTENERTTLVIRSGEREVLFRQIAGALARRICFYIKEGDDVKQSEEMGFIKFGSRVDVFLPPGTKIKVAIGQVVKGGITELAEW